MEPTVGFEPTTYGLRYRCTTVVLRRQKNGCLPAEALAKAGAISAY